MTYLCYTVNYAIHSEIPTNLSCTGHSVPDTDNCNLLFLTISPPSQCITKQDPLGPPLQPGHYPQFAPLHSLSHSLASK